LKFFPSSGADFLSIHSARSRSLQAGLLLASVCGVLMVAWQARADLPRWMQDAVGASSIEAALYRVMQLPGISALYPRPPKEAQSEFTTLIGKAPAEADLYSLRAMEEERALDFAAAEADWKAFASRSKDTIAARLELADYYHRRLQVADEVNILMEVGSSPEQPQDRFIAPAAQRSWNAFERLLLLASDKGLDDAVATRCYTAWIARYPQQPSLYALELRWLLDRQKDESKFDEAGKLIAQYQRAFPHDSVFPLKAAALVEYRRGATGSIAKALAIYDEEFQPLWPAELVESYYALLAQTHNQRQFLSDARARLAHNPDDLNAMARLFYYAQQQGNLITAQQVVEAYRLSKESRKANWSAQELYTLAQLMEAIHAYPGAARYNFALYNAQTATQGALASGASLQAEGLSGMVRILLAAPDQPVELGAGNLTMYRDIATLDHGPGYWNGILSLWLNSASPEQAYHEEEQRARPYFHRAKAAQLLTLLDKNYPKAIERAELHKELIRTFADYGESSLVLKEGDDFLKSFNNESDEANRVFVAMSMADAYARQQNTKDEFALYDRMLAELGAKTAGMPLTAATASNRGPKEASPGPREDAPGTAVSDEASEANEAANPSTKSAEKSRAFEVNPGPPAGVFVAGSQEYQQLLERYLGRLTATGQLPQALAVLRKELDRNPNDPLLYERLASFLQQNNLSAQQEEVYQQAIQKFQNRSWYDKLARLYLREKKREAFADLTKQVTGIFKGTELEGYFGVVRQGGPQLFLQLNLYAHQRFPHDLVFIQNLLGAYQAKATRDPAAWEKLLREHWSDSEQLRTQFFDYLSRTGKLDEELTNLRALVPGANEQKANPAATRELAEVEMWRSHFEASAPLLGSLAEAYPADEAIGTQASSVFRSLAYYDASQTDRAVTVEKHLLAANPDNMDRMARIGDIYADSGADSGSDSGTKSITGHENITAAAPYWRRMTSVHPGTSNGYLQAATIFWDYFQFDDALAEIHQARERFRQPVLFGYEAGAIDEGKRDLSGAIQEYTAAASDTVGSTDSPASRRLLQLARRKSTAKMVDEATARSLEAGSAIAALDLRVRVLKVQKREAEIGPLLEAVLGKATTLEQAQAIGAQAQTNSLTRTYELALQREVALASDPVQKIELSYELARSFEGRKDLDDAVHIIDQVYRENTKLLGVVRTTTDFYWRTKQPAKAIATLIEASKAAEAAQPALSRQFVAEAADKSNDSGNYAQARNLMAPFIDAAASSNSSRDPGYDPYNPQYLSIVAESYARSGDDAGLKQFYLAKLDAIRNSASAMTSEERKQKTVLLRRGLIPALTRMKDYAGTVEQYIAILSAYPEDANTIQEASLYALRYGRQQQLVEFAGNAVKASSRDSRFSIMLAQIQTTYENYPAAIDAYTHAISIRADRADVYAAKADLEERLQRLDDACKDYERLYVLSYQNPDWMVKVAAARARQGRKEDAVKALEHAWIEGHPTNASNYFRVATQLESWNLLEESLRFAKLGVKTEGDDLLAGRAPGNLSGNQAGDDPEGAVVYARLMTRLRRQDAALILLDAARKAADLSPYSPGIVAEQMEKQGIASVTDSEWRKRRIEQRQQTAQQRFHSAVLEMGKTAGLYFTPEEQQQFAHLVDARWKAQQSSAWAERSQWIDVASAAGITDEEASLRKQVLLDRTGSNGAIADAQFNPYLQLERSRMDYSELAQTLEAYTLQLKPQNRQVAHIAEANAYRQAGDEASELRVLRQLQFANDNNTGELERYLQLLLKQDVAGFESFTAADTDKAAALAAPNYAVAHSDFKVTRASLSAHAASLGSLWENAYATLLGLYFHDASPGTEAAFHAVLGDQRTIGERIADHAGANGSGTQKLAGDIWFYYGMRYGVYRALSPEKNWPQRDPEDFLAAGLERNPSAASFIALALAYADAGKSAAALVEYHHALELVPDSPSVYDAMAMLEWQANNKDGAIAEWREALAALNRIQDKGPAPESFWTDFALIAQHLGARKLTTQLHGDMDTVLRNYLARNGNYRSNELLRAAFTASASHNEGRAWLLSLIAAAPDPAGILSDIDTAAWLPKEEREPIYLREIELARIAAAHDEKEDSYATQRLLQLQKSLAIYYVAQKQDAKAEAILQRIAALPDKQQTDGEILQAQIELAARAHTLDALLARYRESSVGPTVSQSLRHIAGVLTAQGDHASALAIWECVFDLGQSHHDLMASDYLGLVEARLELGSEAGNIQAAVEVLHRETLLPGDVYENYNLAAALLEEKGHYAEAIEFLAVPAKGVPWNASYSLRLAQAELRSGKARTEAKAALASIAADSSQNYDLRVQAAIALQQTSAGTEAIKKASLGSSELNLLASGKVTPQQAQQPYFAAARIAAADALGDSVKHDTAASDATQRTMRTALLRQAIAISPAGLSGPAGYTGDALRLSIFRAEAAFGHDSTALDAIQPLLDETYAYTSPTANSTSGENESSEVDASNDSEPDEPVENLDFENSQNSDETLAKLQRLAPLPRRGLQTDAQKLALALLIARAYEHTDSPSNALPYLKLAAWLEKDATAHAELERHIDQIKTALALDSQNALRSPSIRKALDQAGIVRPRLTSADLAHADLTHVDQAHQEAGK
jgi:tetratricopeptide (TPR) repeat protein